MIQSVDQHFKVRLTSWLREQRREGIARPLIRDFTFDEIPQRRKMPITRRVGEVLRFVHAKTNVLGSEILYYLPNGYVPELDLDQGIDQGIVQFYKMLACSESINWQELSFLLNHLAQQGLVENRGRNNPQKSCVITIEGVAAIAELELPPNNSAQAFVAMWFDTSMRSAWSKGVKPAIEDAGYEPLRIDRKEHANRIDDEIISEIKRSRFVVADFTHGEKGARGGVYYEAGFAHGLKIPVIFCCHSDKVGELHFDTRQYNHVIWDTPENLREQLTVRICAVIGDGPQKPQ